MEMKPIGEVVEGRMEVADDYWGGVESVIQLDEAEFPLDSVQGLAEFSHLVVVWHFDRASPSDVEYHARSPRGNTSGRLRARSPIATTGAPTSWHRAFPGCSRSMDSA